MVAVISAYTYHILAFSNLTCHLEDMGIGVSVCTVQTKLRKSDQEACPSAGENTWVVLVPCSGMEVHPYSYLRWCGYF